MTDDEVRNLVDEALEYFNKGEYRQTVGINVETKEQVKAASEYLSTIRTTSQALVYIDGTPSLALIDNTTGSGLVMFAQPENDEQRWLLGGFMAKYDLVLGCFGSNMIKDHKKL